MEDKKKQASHLSNFPNFSVYSTELSTTVSEVVVFLFFRKVIETVLVPQKEGKNPNYEVRGGFETASLS